MTELPLVRRHKVRFSPMQHSYSLCLASAWNNWSVRVKLLSHHRSQHRRTRWPPKAWDYSPSATKWSSLQETSRRCPPTYTDTVHLETAWDPTGWGLGPQEWPAPLHIPLVNFSVLELCFWLIDSNLRFPQALPWGTTGWLVHLPELRETLNLQIIKDSVRGAEEEKNEG